jgi:hypothetical protein
MGLVVVAQPLATNVAPRRSAMILFDMVVPFLSYAWRIYAGLRARQSERR